jgi:lipoprotein-anchoring transpeptidase ErfK/SrfK
MRRILLLTLTIMAVLVAGFLLVRGLNQGDGQRIIVQDFPAVLDPAQPNIAQGPLTPPPSAVLPTPPVPNSPMEPVHPAIPTPDTQPAPELNPDSSGTAPPLSSNSTSSTPESSQSATVPNSGAAPKAGSTADKSDKNAGKPADAADKTATATKTPAQKPAPAKTTSSFDKNGIMTLTAEMQKNGYRKGDPVMVLVDKGSHFTYVLQKQKGDKVVIVWRASNAIGTEETPTPPGPYKVADKTKWPAWVPPTSIDPEQKPVHPYNKDRKNPLGVARIRLDKFQVALHGTNAPQSIRTDASHGCIRHSNNDILKIFGMVEKGDTVVVTDKFVGTKISKKMFG